MLFAGVSAQAARRGPCAHRLATCDRSDWDDQSARPIAAGVLIAPLLIMTAAAEEPSASPTPRPLLSLADAKSRCAPTLVKAGAACEVGDFGPAGTAAGHDFSWARYDFKPAPGDALHPLPWSRVVIFERLAAAMVRPILISGDDAAFGYGKPEILHAGGRVVLHVPAYRVRHRQLQPRAALCLGERRLARCRRHRLAR